MSGMRRSRGERGVSAVIFALMLTSLLTLSAVAVDLGAGFNTRRHAQNTVDAAVMSGMVEAVLGGGVVNDVVAEVRDKVNTSLGRTVTEAEWTACTDPDQLDHTTKELQAGNPTISPVTDCISFSLAFDRLRVRLPQQEALAVFGPALGFGAIKTTAYAVAQIQAPGGISAPPFVALSTATQGDFICLRTSDNPQPAPLLNGMGPGMTPTIGTRADPCDKTVYDTSSQTYGTLAPWRYRSTPCKQQKADTEIGISVGIDHTMGYFKDGYDPLTTPADEVRVDGESNCTVAFPNTFQVESGFNALGLKCALISFGDGMCNGVPSRFAQGESYLAKEQQFAGQFMDNSAPWDFLRPAEELYANGEPYGAPMACVWLAASRSEDHFNPASTTDATPPVTAYDAPTKYEQYTDVDGAVRIEVVEYTAIDMTTWDDSDWDHYDRYDAFIECLERWDPESDPVLFEDDLAGSPRFAFVPKVAEDKLVNDTSGKIMVHIESFQPSFMYRMYQSISSGDLNCAPEDRATGRTVYFYTHDAGQVFTSSCGKDDQNVDRLSSIMLACGMVSADLCNKDTGEPNFSGQDIWDFRLVE